MQQIKNAMVTLVDTIQQGLINRPQNFNHGQSTLVVRGLKEDNARVIQYGNSLEIIQHEQKIARLKVTFTHTDNNHIVTTVGVHVDGANITYLNDSDVLDTTALVDDFKTEADISQRLDNVASLMCKFYSH
ncbi:hypothetical protein AVT69_gp014 [Pseudomonas phage PhiPA3]|uniref:Uncharacterized protein 014 n=1 Tax=Pseudomonas phage PhiPA3 TaxID=998086 RepID=F8SJP5_BPPA3|nr:hypothetical protein AVT69_gp014 [Pseudomonas phage PhiPA3]AEH03440.1 hypothetical protein [Pseudomonas phage PhiPA3]